MKKCFWGIVLSVVLMVMATACSSQTKKTAIGSGKEKVSTTYYQDLSKSNQKSIDFTFKAVEDDSTKSNDTRYIVDMTVKNKSKDDIKMNLSKFFILNPYNTESKVTSDKKQIIVLKKGQKKTIKQIFENVSKDAIDGQGSIYYLNKTYQLAYIYGVTSDKGANSNNLNDDSAKKFNKKKVPEENTEQNSNANAQTTDTSATTDNTSQQNNNTQNSNNSSANVINTSAQAIGLFKHMWGMESRDDFVAEPVNGGFYVHSTEPGFDSLSSTIHYDGSVESTDGTQSSYSQVSGTTYNPHHPDGQSYDPSDY